MVFFSIFNRNKMGETQNVVVDNEPINEEHESLKDWLKINFEPWGTIKTHWITTCALRKLDLIYVKNTFNDILELWPRYSKQLGYELVDIDFSHLYPKSVNNLKILWPTYVNTIIQLAYDDANSNKDKNGIAKFELKDKMLDDENNYLGYLALHAIFYLLPKSNKVSKQNINEMFRKAPKGTLIYDEVRRISTEAAKNKKKELNPFIIYFENDQKVPYKFFVCINSLVYEIGNFMTALDTLFKVYFVFNLNYPKECTLLLTFIQHFFFQIFLPNDIESSSLNGLMCDIDIDRAIECGSMMV